MSKNTKKISRRKFLASSAAFTIVPRYVLGGQNNTPPSEKLNIAAVGIGGVGKRDLKNVETENIVALCDVNEKQAGPVFDAYPKAKKYKDFRKMLEKEKNIDAVMTATPDHTHAVVTMMAIKMGKHVYCQKPLTHTIYEARMLAKAARDARVVTQMGNQGHAGEDIRLVCEWLWDGAIGYIRDVQAWTTFPNNIWQQGIDRPKETPPVPATLDWDLWLGPAPYRPFHPCYLPMKWRGFWDFGTGTLGDQVCHTLDVPFWALKLGRPESVEASSTKVNNETYPEASIVRFKFPPRSGMPAVKMTWYDGGLMPERPEELEPTRRMGNQYGGVLFIGDKGKLMCGTFGESPRLLPESRMTEYKKPAKTIPRSPGVYKEWLKACKEGTPTGSNFDYASALTEVGLLGNIAIRTGKKLAWDGANMKFTNFPEANNYVHKEYRKGWKL